MNERLTAPRLAMACRFLRLHLRKVNAEFGHLQKERGWGPILHAEKQHDGIYVAYVEMVLAAAEAQLQALKSIKTYNDEV